jgi:hypothetical protein
LVSLFTTTPPIFTWTPGMGAPVFRSMIVPVMRPIPAPDFEPSCDRDGGASVGRGEGCSNGCAAA